MTRPQLFVVGLAISFGLFSVGSTYLARFNRPHAAPNQAIEPNRPAPGELIGSWQPTTAQSPSTALRQRPIEVQVSSVESIEHGADSIQAAGEISLQSATLANRPLQSPNVDPVAIANELTASDRLILQELPASCTAGIPGLGNQPTIPDHSEFTTESMPDYASPSRRPDEDKTADAMAIPSEARASNTAAVSSRSPDDLADEPNVANVSYDLPVEATTPQDPALTVDPHAEVFSKTCFPSAAECAKCHQQIYDEWASSSHAYASVSPMFQRFEDTINKLTSGTIGYFCMRCHAPVATIMEHPRDAAIYDGPKVYREGVTCVACHRVREAYTKSNGERRIEPGDIFAPVYGSGDGSGNALAIEYKDLFKIKTSPDDPAATQPIHSQAIQFEQIAQSDFCMSCHQVAVPPGIKLEVVWDQYRASPAYRAGVTCQDCHMGKVPGIESGYTTGPAAVVSDRIVNPHRKHSHHAFYGPGGTIAHPGLFPHDSRADRWTPDQWLEFDWRAGWGRDEFERRIASGEFSPPFPLAWSNADDRYDARELVDANLKKIQIKNDLRRQVMENGSKIDGPFFTRQPQANRDLEFEYCVTNLNPGHNMPSGSLGAQPQLWLNVVLIAPDGERVWETGYLDSCGDLADIQSEDVLCGRLPLDRQLFNLQTKFLTTNVKGTEREMALPINFDVDPLPFIRPAAQPVSVINHPPFIRMEAHSLPPLGSRKAQYRVPASAIRGPGLYRLSIRLRSRMEPIYFMKLCGATPEMMRAMNESILDVHPYSVVFQVQ